MLPQQLGHDKATCSVDRNDHAATVFRMAVGGQSTSGRAAHRGDFVPLNDSDGLGGLEYSRRLFETHGLEFLERLGLLDVCSVACVGGTSQNAGMDDAMSRDHMWGP